MSEILNNLDLYRHLKQLPVEQQQVEYQTIAPQCKFSVKNFNYLMKKGAEHEALFGDAA